MIETVSEYRKAIDVRVPSTQIKEQLHPIPIPSTFYVTSISGIGGADGILLVVATIEKKVYALPDSLREWALNVQLHFKGVVRFEKNRGRILNACLNCLIEKDNLLFCSRCKGMYCSKECQKTSWKLHKHHCEVFKRDGRVLRDLFSNAFSIKTNDNVCHICRNSTDYGMSGGLPTCESCVQYV